MSAEEKPLPDGFDKKTGPAAFADDVDITTLPIDEAGQSAEIEALRSRIAALETDLQQAKDQMLRAMAEAENTRRRAERDREDAGKFAISNFARGLLSVADNFRRALDASDEAMRADTKVAALLTGIEATERELLSAFDRVGIRKIPALEQPFNANLHEVIFEMPGSGKPAGTVMQVVEEGYTIHDRLLRPARVGVARNDAGSAPPTHNLDEQV